MKSLVVFVTLILWFTGINAQDDVKPAPAPAPKDTLKLKHPAILAYQFNRDFTSLDSIGIDTMMPRFQIFYKPNSERALNVFLGNVNLPYESVIFPNRQSFGDYIFSQYIEYNFHQPEEMIYYKTWLPFTKLTYYTGGPKSRQEQKLNILHTQNVNKNLNVGFLGDLNYGDGEYLYQRARSNAFTLWTGYKSQRYSFYGNASLNSYKAQENGGISDDASYLTGNNDANTLSTNLSNANVNIKRQSVFFYQRYYLTGSFKSDSLGAGSRWNEALSIVHKFKYERYRRGFTDNLRYDSLYYSKLSLDPSFNKFSTADSTLFRRFENVIQLAFNANELLKVPAELRVGIKNQIDRYQYGSKLDSAISSIIGKDTFSIAKPLTASNDLNTALVGSLSNRFSKTLRWGADLEYYLTGSKLGDFNINGDIEKSIRKFVVLKLSGQIARQTPSFFIRQFKSNHFEWSNNNFPKQTTNVLRGGLYFTKFKFFVDAQLNNYFNFIYFGADARPTFAKDLSVQSLTATKLIDWGFFHTEIRLTGQNSSDYSAVAIPSFSAFNSTYVEFTLFKVLHMQVGGDLFYNTSFKADSYMPETGLFYSQDAISVGKYPYADVFLNTKLKRFRFFLKYERINTFFPNDKGFYLPHYPYNPSQLKYGLSWTFYD